MKKIYTIPLLLLVALIVISATKTENNFTEGFVTGDLEVKSINALTFGPEGILFIGDSKSAKVYAMATNDTKAPSGELKRIVVRKLDEKLAEKLGTTAANVRITDMAVNPLSKKIYLAVQSNDGTPLLFTLNNNELSPVALNQVTYSEVALKDAVSEDKKDRRGRSQRVWAIADMKYHNNQLMVTGLSNKEFSSTFRSIPFPFKGDQNYASLEIYHAAHGQFETFAPIKTFTVTNINGKDHLLASYTCTPLVLFPMDELKNGNHVKGRTVAELGAGNSPVDIISMEKGGESFLLMSNTNRAVMKLRKSDVAGYKGTLTEPINEPGRTEGVDYISLPMVNVLQLDKLSDNQFVFIQRTSSGEMIMASANNRWL